MVDQLLGPFRLGHIQLQNRMVMAPMTRSRADLPGNVPNDLMAKYYSQRAGAGLIITEATQVSLQGQGYARTPGIYSREQVAGWKKVTDAVHAEGGRIFLQLWHVGRVSSAKVNGLQPVAPSAVMAGETQVYVFDDASDKAQPGDATFVDLDEPREMDVSDIRRSIADFRQAARNAVDAGFDGVEIHGANGYLIDQFLRGNSNRRSDEYGGSPEKRTRFLREVCEAVIAEVGKERVGVRLSPHITFKDMGDPEIFRTFWLVVSQLNELGVRYLHMSEADWDDAPDIPPEFRQKLRGNFGGNIIVAGNKTPEIAAQLLGDNLADLVAFGRNFLTSPDLPKRFAIGAAPSPISNTHHLFGGGGAEGYTDYPFLP
ncbi:alkene reductase [Candidatus Haliotispira prima]|uniref:Alkene reductase n=1 Tax=Candidatus Haliotispira prima TaxID=3034016 RepID=A0ABY8MK90_9SPIO|nr:alkene reductase [Candidatus Haliotispira prima]